MYIITFSHSHKKIKILMQEQQQQPWKLPQAIHSSQQPLYQLPYSQQPLHSNQPSNPV
jgi:hypothetical protein